MIRCSLCCPRTSLLSASVNAEKLAYAGYKYSVYELLSNPVKDLAIKLRNAVLLDRIKRSMRIGRVPGCISIAENGFWRYRHPPVASLKRTAAYFQQIQGETIIEVGTGVHGKMSGNSMFTWTRRTSAKRIIAIDLEDSRLEEVRSITRGFSNVELILGDGIEYLKHFPGRIDLLYLDFWVPDPSNTTLEGIGRAHAYRDAFIAARDKLNFHSMILIDDTDHIHPWKHTYIVPLARESGYDVLYTGRQTLLKR